jgi:ubiquinone/menaquinone biosynthesis C-methylase UbiE
MKADMTARKQFMYHSVINLSTDKLQGCREMYRVLKPGGRVSVSDIVTHGPFPEAVQSSMDAWDACVAGALDLRDYQAGLQAAGVVDVHITARTESGAGLTTLPEHTPFTPSSTPSAAIPQTHHPPPVP